MRRHLSRILFAVACASAAAVGTAPAAAQSPYPNRPVRLVVPFAAGGSADILARATATLLSKALGQSFVVDDRPGASGNIGAEIVARAQPDGYTLLFTTTNLTMNPAVLKDVPYDAVTDYAPVTMVAFAPMILITGPQVPAKNLGELIAAVRASPGKYNFSSSGKGGAPHLAGELMKQSANLDMVHVPYNGAAPALTDVAAGQVQMTFTTYVSAKSMLETGKVHALAVADKQRLEALPDLPTFEQAGVKGVEIGTMYGLLAPSKTSPDIVAKLYATLAEAARTDAFKREIAAQGASVVLNSPDVYRDYIRNDVSHWKTLITKIGGVE